VWTRWRDVDRDRKQGRWRGSENRGDRPTCRYFELRIKKKRLTFTSCNDMVLHGPWLSFLLKIATGYGLGHLVFLGL
jgi:hypothetical protein